MQQRQRVGLVVVGGAEAELADSLDDRRLVGVALPVTCRLIVPTGTPS